MIENVSWWVFRLTLRGGGGLTNYRVNTVWCVNFSVLCSAGLLIACDQFGGSVIVVIDLVGRAMFYLFILSTYLKDPYGCYIGG